MASVAKKLKLVQRIDTRLKLSKVHGSSVSHGQRVLAMILNGLGFNDSRLYLSPDYFKDKPVAHLIGEDVDAGHLNDDALVRTLDAIYEYGTTKLLSEMAFEIATENKLFGTSCKLDTSSLKLFGEYDYDIDVDTEKRPPIPTYGLSKDHRPDLKQVVLSLTVSGPAAMPLWFESLDGNSSDKKNFHDTLKQVRSFQAQLKNSPSFLWVADSALYTKGELEKTPIRWLTRVPETLTQAKEIVTTAAGDFGWEALSPGYLGVRIGQPDALFEQDWLLVYSEQAAKRETITLNKRKVNAEGREGALG